MFGYFQILESAAKLMTSIAEWFGDVVGRITHDPVWGGATLGVIVLIIVLIVMKKGESG